MNSWKNNITGGDTRLTTGPKENSRMWETSRFEGKQNCFLGDQSLQCNRPYSEHPTKFSQEWKAGYKTCKKFVLCSQ